MSDNFFPPPKEQTLALRSDFLLAHGDFDYGGEHQGAEGLATFDITQEIEAAGGQNVFAEPNKYTVEVSLETVASKQADA